MPLLSYSAITDYPFVPFTKIYSADINLMFSTIQTLLNTTKLDFANVQALGLKRYGSAGNFQAGTANFAVYNDSSGYLKESASLPTTAGGLGFIPSVSSATAGQVIGVNGAGTSFTLVAPGGPTINVFNSQNFS